MQYLRFSSLLYFFYSLRIFYFNCKMYFKGLNGHMELEVVWKILKNNQ